MSKILYSTLGIFYKLATAAVFVIVMLAVFMNLKKSDGYRRYLIVTMGIIASQLITAIVNYQYNFTGNIIEIIFMCSYMWLLVPLNKKTIDKIMMFTAYCTQVASFLLFVFTLVMVIFRLTIYWQPSGLSSTVYFGLVDGRIWGFVNPNSTSILAYASILLGLVLIFKQMKYAKFIKYNIICQIINIAFQQSRGAMISSVVMIALYVVFIHKDLSIIKKIKRIVLLTGVFVVAMVGINSIVSSYLQLGTSETITIDYTDSKLNFTEKKESSKKEELTVRISESTSSGRMYIWENGLVMGLEKPVFGYGTRNLQSHYNDFFNKYTIENSLIGGNFHNIFLTLFVASGALGLVAFTITIVYVSVEFLKFLWINVEKEKSLYMILFFGILTGQLFESIIFYSTNFINILFWMVVVYGVSLCNEYKNSPQCQMCEITDIEELQRMELAILDYIHEICEKEGIQYFLSYGTLIGAVRHKGFIPWDDDIDIWLFRDQYEKLQSYLLEHDNEKFGLKSYHNDPSYMYPFMKIIDKDTYLLENGIRLDSKLGVYIDIFPIDGHIEDKEFEQEMSTLIKKSQLCSYSFEGVKAEGKPLENIMRYGALAAYSLKDVHSYVKAIDELAKTRKIDGEYCDFLMYKSMKKPTIKTEWFKEAIDWEFCGKYYKIPIGYDQILRADYGDYMQLPPVDKQVSHHNFKAWELKK
ncbi:LicD family protein [Granulicatella balaenopterae]|nr:LicD family protein [Granulicatella balaenopterae]